MTQGQVLEMIDGLSTDVADPEVELDDSWVLVRLGEIRSAVQNLDLTIEGGTF